MSAILPNGTISSLNCDSGRTIGGLYIATTAAGVSFKVPYKGGNGGVHLGDSVVSTGVTGFTAKLSSDSFRTGNDTLTYTVTGLSNTSGTASFSLNIGGKSCIYNIPIQVPPGAVTTLKCDSAIYTGTTLQSLMGLVSGVQIKLPYTGGNGGNHSGQTVSSTGITGLAATTTSGNFKIGDSFLIYNVSGYLSYGFGTGSFNFNIGGKSCVYNFYVKPHSARIATLECNLYTVSTPVVVGISTNGKTIRLPYRGGNGGSYPKQIINSQRVTGLTATLDSSIVKNGDSSFVLTLTGTASVSDTAIFPLTIAGQSCSLYLPILPPAAVVSTLDCQSITISNPIVKGVSTIGTELTLPYTGGNGGSFASHSVNSTGVTGVTASISGGKVTNNNGNLIYSLTGVPNSAGSLSMTFTLGGKTCTYTKTIPLPDAAVSTLDCSKLTMEGILTEQEEASGVSFDLPYTGSNGGTYSEMIIASTSVTGLNATINGGTLMNGNGILHFLIEGIPDKSGTALFKIVVGDKSCYARLKVEAAPISSILSSHSTAIFKQERKIFFQNITSNTSYALISLSGQIIYRNMAPKGNSILDLESLNLHRGIYILHYQSDKETGSLKFDY